MKIITDSRCTQYFTPHHPERPQRVERTMERLKAQKEIFLSWGEPVEANDAQILRAHSAGHLDHLRKATEMFDADTPAYVDILGHARRSVGGALHALDLAGHEEIGFSLMRPPGHHATRQQAMGFCYLNSIATAALEAKARGFKKVAIFDFDVHHGNGTEDILLDVPGCAFFSIHQHPAYPGTGTAHRGSNCFNFPVAPLLPAAAYRGACSAAMEQLKKFRPDIIGISAGFDSYKRDPLCQQQMEAEDFHWVGRSLRGFGVPTFAVLEGGYSNDLPELILNFLCGLEGAPPVKENG